MVCSGCASVLSTAHPQRHLGEGNMPKKPHPQISQIPPQTSDKHPRVWDPADSSSWSCGTCETLAVPPAWPWRRVKGISVNAVLAQPSCCRKGF